MTREEWDKRERQIANGKIAYFFDDVRREFLYAFRQNRMFVVQDESGYTLKSASKLKEIGIYLTAKRRY